MALRSALRIVAVAAAGMISLGARASQTPASRSGTWWAIVVGVDQYESKDINRLDGAVADARGIASVLRQYVDIPQDHVSVLVSDGATKPTRKAIFDAIEDLKKTREPIDLLLFFFAGHGIEADGQRLLLTYETDASSLPAIKTSALQASVLMQELETVKVKNRIVMVDACRDNPLAGESRPNVATESFETAFTIRSRESGVRATFLSTSQGQSAFEWLEKRRGFFSYFIEKGLSGEAALVEDEVTVSSLRLYLEANVPRAVRMIGQKQTPYTLHDGGPFVLVRSDKLAIRPSPAPSSAAPVRTVYGVVKDAGGTPLREVLITVAAATGGGSRSVGLTSPRAEVSQAPPLRPAVRTDDQGRFKVDGLPDLTVEVRAELPGYTNRSTVTPPAEDGKMLSLFLPRTVAAGAGPVGTAPPDPPRPLSPAERAAELAGVAYRSFFVEDFTQAEASARAALTIDPNHAVANAVLGNSLAFVVMNDKSGTTIDQAKLAEAREHADRALRLNPGLPLAHNALGLVELAAGDASKAQKEFARAIALDPGLAVAHANLAHTYYDQKRYGDAERWYRSAIKARPENAIPYNGLAEVLTARKKYRDAAQALRNAISLYELRDAHLGAFYVNLGVALYYQKLYDQGMEAISQAKRLGVKTHPAYAIIERAFATSQKR
jgi:tetratricopeptide (TPR) repeat protein